MAVLSLFFEQMDVLSLIFVRVIAFFMFLPVISIRNIPALTRVFFAFIVSIALFSSGLVTYVPYTDSESGYVYLLLKEFMVGIVMSYVLFTVFNLIYFAGQIIDYMIGFSMTNVLDPMMQIQVPIVGNLYYLMISAILVASGGLHVFFYEFFRSYQVLPIGAAWVVGNEPLAWFITLVLMDFIEMGVRIALPIMGAIMVLDAALGIMVRTVPQMNIFVVGLPVKLLIGLILLYAMLTPSMSLVYNFIIEYALRMLDEVMWGMLR